MSTQHTPGPWIATETTTHDYNALGDTLGIGIRVEADGCGHRWHIANVFGQMDESKPLATDHGYAQANARLIASAPDLLAALRIIHANAAESVEWIRRHTAEAIAKATGEEVTR